ncbi:hypothetical protein V1519DRAFT_234967 [Lipomyces tetrasporus]
MQSLCATEDLAGARKRCPLCAIFVANVVGPVGSGKTTFLRAILNELPEIEGELASYGSTFAFCDQSPWLVNSTVQKNIIGEALLDSEWYYTVSRACALDVYWRYFH